MAGQLVRRTFSIERQPRSSEPVWDIPLQRNESIVSVAHYWTVDSEKRSTVDHHVAVWIYAHFEPMGEPT